MKKTLDKKVKDDIFVAAQSEFFEKGYDGARMQAIADKAGINKAMLHYYFKSKEGLFEEVFIYWFQQYFPSIVEVLNDESSLFDKIRKICSLQISVMQKNPHLPLFINNELSKGNIPIQKILKSANLNHVQQRFSQLIDTEVQKGEISPISPFQLLLNILSLNLFPFVSKDFLHLNFGIDTIQFNQLMEKRKLEVPEFIIESIKKR